MVYGAYANNPVPLTEDAILRPDVDFVYARQLATVEAMADRWRRARAGRSVTVLRPVVAMAADGTPSLAAALAAGYGQRLGEDDPPAQFLHLDDLASAVTLAVERELDGVYNVAPDSFVPAESVRALATTSAAFLHHAFNPQTKRFHNFLSFDRRWLDELGSEDCQGRALWALGIGVGRSPFRTFQMMAGQLFAQALPLLTEFTSPRAWAFGLIGIDEYLRRLSGDSLLSVAIRGAPPPPLLAASASPRRWIQATARFQWDLAEDAIAPTA